MSIYFRLKLILNMYVYMHMHVCTYACICAYMSPHSILKYNLVDVLQILVLWPKLSMDA